MFVNKFPLICLKQKSLMPLPMVHSYTLSLYRVITWFMRDIMDLYENFQMRYLSTKSRLSNTGHSLPFN